MAPSARSLQTQAEFVSVERRKLRIALTISGAVSLGSFEGGALAALVTAVQRTALEPDSWLEIDAIGGASAGAITGVLTARALHAGLDPIELMRRAWVDESSMSAMLSKTKDAPLTTTRLEAVVDELLRVPPADEGRGRQRADIRMEIALANLRGLTYDIPRLRATRDRTAVVTPIEGHTHLDWGSFTFRHTDTAEAYTSPPGASAVEFALASGANAFGFRPRLLRRDVLPQDVMQQTKHPIKNFPASGSMWYTDGGTIDNEPLGRTLDLTNEIDAAGEDCHRLHLLIHPHPTSPPAATDDAWADPADVPKWTRTAVKAFELRGSQGIYDDLRHVEKTNSRLIWKERLRSELSGLLDDASRAKLSDLLEEIQGEREEMMSSVEGRASQPSRTDPLGRLLDLVSGLSGKSPVMVDEVSPRILLADPPDGFDPSSVENLLSGEFLLHFGGFLDRRLRASDFALGYECMLRWLRLNLDGYIDPGCAQRALDEVEASYPGRIDDLAAGAWAKTSVPSLGPKPRGLLKRTLSQVAEVALSDAAPGPGASWRTRAFWWVARPVVRWLPSFLLGRLTRSAPP